MKIGYQGVEGSNSEAAAKVFAEKQGFENYILVPCTSSVGVANNLQEGKIEYGVIAKRNSNVGLVKETDNVFDGSWAYTVVAELKMPVHHHLYVANEQVTEVNAIGSHAQAIQQSAGNIAKMFPSAITMRLEDTALSAKYLSEGKLGLDVGVLCRDTAGTRYGLHLYQPNMQDDPANHTHFELVRLG